jgi:hypothetical protein
MKPADSLDGHVLPVFLAYLKDPGRRGIDLVHPRSNLVGSYGKTGHSSNVSPTQTGSPYLPSYDYRIIP